MKKTIKKILSLPLSIVDVLFPDSSPKEEEIMGCLNISKKFSPFGQISLFSYSDQIIKESFWQIKFKQNRRLAKIFAQILSDVLIEELYSLESLYNFDKPILVKVPSSKKSLSARGYDHNMLLLSTLVKNNSILFKDVIIKTRNTERQSHFKGKAEREDNAKNSFKIVNGSLLRERNIILFDDLVTSGATITECKRILKNHGVNKILTLTIAR